MYGQKMSVTEFTARLEEVASECREKWGGGERGECPLYCGCVVAYPIKPTWGTFAHLFALSEPG